MKCYESVKKLEQIAQGDFEVSIFGDVKGLLCNALSNAI